MKNLITIVLVSLSTIACTSEPNYKDSLVGKWKCQSNLGSIVTTDAYYDYSKDGVVKIHTLSEAAIMDEDLSNSRGIIIGNTAKVRVDLKGTWSIDGSTLMEKVSMSNPPKPMNVIAEKIGDRLIEELAKEYDGLVVHESKILKMDTNAVKLRRLGSGKIETCHRDN